MKNRDALVVLVPNLCKIGIAYNIRGLEASLITGRIHSGQVVKTKYHSPTAFLQQLVAVPIIVLRYFTPWEEGNVCFGAEIKPLLQIIVHKSGYAAALLQCCLLYTS